MNNQFRGLGVSQLMLAKVEEQAKKRGCCKITLEVLEGNEIARNSYMKFGFDGYELDPEMGKALFWQKTLYTPIKPLNKDKKQFFCSFSPILTNFSLPVNGAVRQS